MRTIIPTQATLVPAHAKCVFKGEIFEVYQWPETMFDGTTATFEMLRRDDSVEVLVVHDNKLLVQKQEQPHIGHFYSFPGGRHDHDGETEIEGCMRELREETGYTCHTWNLVSVLQTHPKIEAFYYLFVATGIGEQVPQQLDAGERIENMWLSLREVQELIEKGNFRSLGHMLFEGISEANDLLQIAPYRL